MSNLRHYSIVMLFCVFLLMLPFESVSPIEQMMVNESMTPTAIDITQMIPDPNLEAEPDAFVNGSSGEFSYNYSDGIMLLNWTHDRSNLLVDQSADDDRYPSWSDFVYFTQSFDWPVEEMPEDARAYFNYSISRSGGLALSEVTGMFKIYLWFIDSSGNWFNIYATYYGSTEFYERQANLDHFDLLEGFRGMVEDSSGVQEDPEDTLTLGIGLAPTPLFNNSVDDGAVIVEVTSMKMYVIMQAEPDPATHLTPLYNETFGWTISEIFPRFIGDTTPVGDNLKAIATDPEGNIYLTGYSSGPYDFFIENGVSGSFQFLIKYNPILNRQWLVRNTNQSRGFAIAYHDGNIFTSGCYYRYDIPEYADLMLTKWGPSGQKIWEKEWGGDDDQIGVALDVHDDGSIYVIVSDYNLRGAEPAYQNSSLLKFDSSGNVLWNKPLPLCTIMNTPGELWVYESHLIYFIHGLLMCMDLNGNVLWEKNAMAATCDDNGTIYTGDNALGAVIHQYDLEGNETWSSYYEIEYGDDWIEWLFVHDLALTPDNELLVLVQGNIFDDSYHLLKYDLNGTHQQTWSIGDEAWPWAGGYIPFMEVTSTGLVYFSFGHMSWDVWTQAYAIGDYTLPPFLPSLGSLLAIVTIGGGVGVIALIGVYAYKRKRIQ